MCREGVTKTVVWRRKEIVERDSKTDDFVMGLENVKEGSTVWKQTLIIWNRIGGK